MGVGEVVNQDRSVCLVEWIPNITSHVVVWRRDGQGISNCAGEGVFCDIVTCKETNFYSDNSYTGVFHNIMNH